MHRGVVRLFLVVVCGCITMVWAEPTSQPRLIQVRKIWDQGQYNSFTDLVTFRNTLFCVFREGSKHGVSEDGSIRILASKDAVTWKPTALITSDEGDLRDPHLTVTPDNRLMLSVCIAKHDTRVTS